MTTDTAPPLPTPEDTLTSPRTCRECGGYYPHALRHESWCSRSPVTDTPSLDVSPELRALSEAATPGPWEVHTGMAATIWRPDASYMVIGDAIYHPEYVADATLIVAAVNDLRARLSQPVASEETA